MSPEELLPRRRLSMDGVHRAKIPHDMRTGRIAVIGVGRTGLPLAILAASKKIEVVAYDIDAVKIAQLERREAHFLDDEFAHAFKRAQSLTLTASDADLKHIDTFIICVSTPLGKERRADMRPLEEAAHMVGTHITAGNLVIVETSVNPGICEHIVLPILEKQSGLPRGDFYFAHVPERVQHARQGATLADTPRVIGGLNTESILRARSLYEKLLGAKLVTMHSIQEAEAVQLLEHALRNVGSALLNELAMSFDRAGIDIVPVFEAAAMNPSGFFLTRPSATETPANAGDPYVLMRRGHENSLEHQLLATARRINESMPHYLIKILSDGLREKRKKIKGATVALLGLPQHHGELETGGPDGSIHDALVKKGAHVQTFDPFVAGAGRDLKAALKGADAALIAVNSPLFSHLTPRQFEEFGIFVVIDGSNCLDAAAFKKSPILYRGIGR